MPSCEKDSPNKENSRLSNSVGTPERKKFSMKRVQVPGTRAAVMLACARRTRRTKDETIEKEGSPKSSLLTEKVSNADYSRFSPRSITPKRKSPLTDSLFDERPWAKHEPSPTASPCGSILKKRQVEDESLSTPLRESTDKEEESSSMTRNRRVSFADPPVSEKVVIPSSQNFKIYKAQKRLDMTRAMNPISYLESGDSQNSQEDEEITLDMPNCSQPIYSSLVDCSDSIDKILSKLTSSSLVKSLKTVFQDRDIKTIGDLCSITEKELMSLPVRSPKKSKTINCLKQYEKSLKRKKNTENEENLEKSAITEPESSIEPIVVKDKSENEVNNTDHLTLLEYGPDICNSQDDLINVKPTNKKDHLVNVGEDAEKKELVSHGMEAGKEDGVEAEKEDGVEAEKEDVVEAEKEDGVVAEKEDGVEAEKEDGVEAEKEDGVVAEKEDGVEGEKEDGVEGEKEDGVEAEKEDVVEAQEEDGMEAEKEDGVEAEKEDMMEIENEEHPLICQEEAEQDSELPVRDLKKICEEIEKADELPSFVKGLSREGKVKLLENLTSAIPYKCVIDSFHKYLTQQQNIP